MRNYLFTIKHVMVLEKEKGIHGGVEGRYVLEIYA